MNNMQPTHTPDKHHANSHTNKEAGLGGFRTSNSSDSSTSTLEKAEMKKKRLVGEGLKKRLFQKEAFSPSGIQQAMRLEKKRRHGRLVGVLNLIFKFPASGTKISHRK